MKGTRKGITALVFLLGGREATINPRQQTEVRIISLGVTHKLRTSHGIESPILTCTHLLCGNRELSGSDMFNRTMILQRTFFINPSIKTSFDPFFLHVEGFKCRTANVDFGRPG